jgi:hypothetical protein
MADISPIASGLTQSVGWQDPRDGRMRHSQLASGGRTAGDNGVSVDISKVGKALGGLGSDGLSEAEERQVKELKDRDREVRSHEAAHIAAGGGLVRGGATYQYRSGPDGHLYAVGGEVNIDTSTVPGNPDATIRKAEQIKRAAEAPADPSGQDRAVAAEAQAMEAEAQREKVSAKSGENAQPNAPLHAGSSRPLMDKPKPLSDAAIG